MRPETPRNATFHVRRCFHRLPACSPGEGLAGRQCAETTLDREDSVAVRRQSWHRGRAEVVRCIGDWAVLVAVSETTLGWLIYRGKTPRIGSCTTNRPYFTELSPVFEDLMRYQ